MPLNNGAEATATITGGSFDCDLWSIYNSGTLTAEDITIKSNHPTGLGATWNCVKNAGGVLALTNVTIDAVGNGGIEAAGGQVTLNDCTITQSGIADPQSWNAMCVAVSGGGELTVNGGTYHSQNFGVYVFSSGGTATVNGGEFEASTVLRTDTEDGAASAINVSGGTFSGVFRESNGTQISVTGGTFTNDGASYDVSEFVPNGLALTQNEKGELVQNEAAAVASVGGVGCTSLAAAIEAAPENGTVELSDDSAKAGDEVTITATPDLGYEVGSVTVTSGGEAVEVTDNEDGTWTFTMPKGDVEVSVEFADAWESPFTDVYGERLQPPLISSRCRLEAERPGRQALMRRPCIKERTAERPRAKTLPRCTTNR